MRVYDTTHVHIVIISVQKGNNMTEQEQIRENIKVELEKNKEAMLANSKDEDTALKLMKEFSELTLFITSFEFTQKIVEDPSFMKQIMEQMENDRPSQ